MRNAADLERRRRPGFIPWLATFLCLAAALTAPGQATPGLSAVEPVEVGGIPEPICSRTSRLDLSPLAESVLARIETVAGALGKSPVPASQILSTCNRFVAVAVRGPAIYGEIRDVLALAEHEVNIAFFAWDRGSYAVEQMGLGLLAAQAQHSAGDPPLLVRLLLDDLTLNNDDAILRLYGSVLDWQAMGLDAARVQFQLGTAQWGFFGSPLHDKLVVVDGRYVAVTGANPELHHDPPNPWHDAGFVLEGDVALSSLAAFDQTWTGDAEHWACFSSGNCWELSYHFDQPPRPWLPLPGFRHFGDVPVLAVGKTKDGKDNAVGNDVNNPQDLAWLELMDGAASSILVESPNINDNEFQDAVVRAVQRGVTVRLISPLGFNKFLEDLPSQGGDNQDIVAALRQRVRAAAPLGQERFKFRWYSPNGYEPLAGNVAGASHTKYLSVDGQVAMVGSGNQDTASWNISHEYNLLIDDPAVTQQIDDTLFWPAWNTSIGTYVELYEGNGATQELVCPVAVLLDKTGMFINDDPKYCDNDETRSLLLHDVPAGRVLRFFDDGGFDYHDDDWVEVLVKRPVSRKVIASYEQSFEDADVRVIYHHDNGLDGKVSSLHVSSFTFGAVMDFYAGNGGSGGLVCSNRVTGTGTIDLTADPYCENDEARSVKLYDFPADRVIFVHDSSSGSQRDDWGVLVPKRQIAQATLASFETSVENADFKYCAFYRDNLDGKVSRIRVGTLSEASGACPLGGSDPGPSPADCSAFDYSQCEPLYQCQQGCLIGAPASSIGHECCACGCTGSDPCPICLLPF